MLDTRIQALSRSQVIGELAKCVVGADLEAFSLQCRLIRQH